MPRITGVSFTAQSWRGHERLVNIEDLSYDAARHIAQTHAALGETGRIMSEAEDYCEVYCSNGTERRGTFGDTTVVIIR